ncbi:MAG: GNAT family N-acetyltransferase [Cyanobacteriota bacterium]
MSNTAPGDGFSLSAPLALMHADNQPARPQSGKDPCVRIVRHGRGAIGLQLGLAPDLWPAEALRQLQRLLSRNAFWCQGRSVDDLRQMLHNSAVCVTAWRGRTLIGFGRATSDAVYRGTIWDVVVDAKEGGRGVGTAIVEGLLASKALVGCERIYLMTTNSSEFYRKLGFQTNQRQVLMVKEKSG